ncbi:MAG: hypothetical protein V4722_10045 [Bacteroidota bacterium]
MKSILIAGICLLGTVTVMGQFVGIGADVPLSKLHIKGGGLLIEGPQGNTPFSGAGIRLMWVPARGVFRAGEAIGNFWDHDSLGFYSAAFGQGNRAIGTNSFSTGESNISRSSASATFGFNNKALQNNAAAFGAASNAGGYASFAMGFNAQTYAQASLTIGAYNDVTDNPNPLVMAPEDRSFQIGNGTSSGSRSNAMTVLRNGNVGIGVVNPVTSIHTDGGIFSVGEIDSAVISGAGARLMWIPKKWSLRAGKATATSWQKDSIGTGSVAFGFGNRAIGAYSFSSGTGNISRDTGSFSFGFQCEATADYAVAMGRNSMAAHHASTALGYFVVSKSVGCLSVGSCNDISDTPPVNAFNENDRVFQVGNGLFTTSRSNAMTVLRNGNVGIGILIPTEKLHITGNAIITGNATVKGDGVITGTTATVQKIVVIEKAVSIPNMPVNATGQFTFTWGTESFASTPVAYVGNVVDNSPGGFAECDFTLVDITATGGTLFVHNTMGAIHTKGFSINIIGMGAK